MISGIDLDHFASEMCGVGHAGIVSGATRNGPAGSFRAGYGVAAASIAFSGVEMSAARSAGMETPCVRALRTTM